MSIEQPEAGETVSIVKAMELCSVSRRTIYNWIKQGKIQIKRLPSGGVRIFKASLWKEDKHEPS